MTGRTPTIRETEELLAPLGAFGRSHLPVRFRSPAGAPRTTMPGSMVSATSPTAKPGRRLGDHSRLRRHLQCPGLLLRKLGSPHRRRNGAGRQLHGEPDRCADDRGVRRAPSPPRLATNFAGSVFGRLDAYRTFDQFDMGATSAIAATPRRPRASAPAAPENRWSVYGGANYSGGGGESAISRPRLQLQRRRRHARARVSRRSEFAAGRRVRLLRARRQPRRPERP